MSDYQQRIRIRGQIDIQSQDGAACIPREWFLYEEGTDTPVTVGALDHIEIDFMFVSSSNGFTDVHFSHPNTLYADLSLPHRIYRSKLAQNVTLPFTHPVVGPLGYGVWGTNAGANAVEGTFWGWLYRG